MLIVGLTGGIASGKTTISDMFAARGVPIVDADIAARQVVEPGQPGLAELTTAFGRDILNDDGSLNRRALRQRVFARQEDRARLESILHPLIRDRILQDLEAARAGGAPYVLLVAPLLLEGGLARIVDRVLVIDTPREVQIERVMARDNCSQREAEAILAAQMSREERLARADDVIVNAGAVDDLAVEVERLHRQYLELAAQKP